MGSCLAQQIIGWSIITTMPQASMARSQESKIGCRLWVGWRALLSLLSIRTTLANSGCLSACTQSVFSCLLMRWKGLVMFRQCSLVNKKKQKADLWKNGGKKYKNKKIGRSSIQTRYLYKLKKLSSYNYNKLNVSNIAIPIMYFKMYKVYLLDCCATTSAFKKKKIIQTSANWWLSLTARSYQRFLMDPTASSMNNNTLRCTFLLLKEPVSWRTATRNGGHQVWNSFTHWCMTVAGHTMTVGPNPAYLHTKTQPSEIFTT